MNLYFSLNSQTKTKQKGTKNWASAAGKQRRAPPASSLLSRTSDEARTRLSQNCPNPASTFALFSAARLSLLLTPSASSRSLLTVSIWAILVLCQPKSEPLNSCFVFFVLELLLLLFSSDREREGRKERKGGERAGVEEGGGEESNNKKSGGRGGSRVEVWSEQEARGQASGG